MLGKYILGEDGEPVACNDLITWGKFMEEVDRSIADDTLPNGARISTVFLGVDHRFGAGPPILWETMIFGGPHDGFQERYSSKTEAFEGHQAALKLASGEN